MTLVTAGSCVIADRPDYSGAGPNFPPAIQDDPASSFSLNRVNVLSSSTGGDAGTATNSISVFVLDANITQTLFVRTIITGPNGEEILLTDTLVPTGRVDRAFSRPIFPSFLLRDCNRIEMNVSSEFAAGSNRTPATTFDIATAVWYVATEDGVTVGECP